MTAFRGLVRHGDSGGPVVNADGAVETTVFAAREGSDAGYGVPTAVVRKALAAAHGSVFDRRLRALGGSDGTSLVAPVRLRRRFVKPS